MHKCIAVKKGKVVELRYDRFQRQIYRAPEPKKFAPGFAISSKVVSQKILRDIKWNSVWGIFLFFL